MKILIDVGHPGHYHLFKNTMQRAISEGYEVIVVLRDKDNAGLLTKQMNVEIVSLGGHKKGMFSKIIFSIITLSRILRIMSKTKPDVAISESNFLITYPAWIMRIPSVMVAMNDHTMLENPLLWPIRIKIITSETFKMNLGKNQIKFKGYLQYLYLKNFIPKEVKAELGISKDEKYAVIRRVYWGAHHDIGKSGLSDDQIMQIINLLDGYKIFISSEAQLPESLRKYALPTEPKRFQDVLYYSSLCISEGATVAAEAAIMGIPTVYTSHHSPGYIEGMVRDKILYHFSESGNTSKLLFTIKEAIAKEDRDHINKIVSNFDDPQEILWSNIMKFGGAHETQ